MEDELDIQFWMNVLIVYDSKMIGDNCIFFLCESQVFLINLGYDSMKIVMHL